MKKVSAYNAFVSMKLKDLTFMPPIDGEKVSHKLRFKGATDAWQDSKPVMRRHGDKVEVRVLTVPEDEAPEAAAAVPAAPPPAALPAARLKVSGPFGCTKCRQSKGGCLKCNSNKKAAHAATKNINKTLKAVHAATRKSRSSESI
jgi:hypothetical protein